METRPSNFSVVSKGYCFLCLNKITFDITQSSPVNSFQDISRYLKINMRKVFIQGGAVPPHLLAKVERARLKIELCEECASMTEGISKQCRELEKLKMEIESGLESIHGKMFEAEETGRSEKFRGLVEGSEINSGMGGWIEILEVLRTETKQKCVSKMKAASPRTRIPKVTPKEIHKRTLRITKPEAAEPTEQMSDARDRDQRDRIKIAEPIAAVWVAEDDDGKQSDDSFTDALHHEVGESDSGPMSTEGHGDDHTWGPWTHHQATERKWILNPETGKYKCRLCTVEFASVSGSLYSHYNTVHRRIRFKCQICGKEFTQKGDYKRHHESVHLGVRFQCKFCKKSFTQKGGLLAHQRKAGCATR